MSWIRRKLERHCDVTLVLLPWLVIFALIVSSMATFTDAFVVQQQGGGKSLSSHQYHQHPYKDGIYISSRAFISLPPLLMAKKPSMAEKRKRRAQATQRRQQALEESVAKLPKSKLDFKTPPPPPSPSVAAGTPATATTTSPEQTKAKALIQSQRESVQMLTHVTHQIETTIDLQQLSTDLSQRGYYVLDHFLNDSVVETLQLESQQLYASSNMTTDVRQLGMGQFVAALVGGAEQYPSCPRSIEWVVSVTSKLSARINGAARNDTTTSSQEGEYWKGYDLNDRACSRALARFFDRSALLASQKLLLLGENGDKDEATVEQAIANLQAMEAFQTVMEQDAAADDTTTTEQPDLRRLSVFYYLVPEGWEEPCGGHLSFQQPGKDDVATIHTVHAKRNRLVLWKSDTTAYQREPFRGSETMPMASSLELHLVQKQS